MTRRGILWTTAALAGIVVTAALAWFASQLAGQRIGLSSEPLSVTSGLAPARQVIGAGLKPGVQRAHRPRSSSHPKHAVLRSQPTTTVYIAPAPAPSAPVVTAPTSSATSATPGTAPAGSSSTPRQRDDNGGGSGNGGGGSHGGGQRDD